MGAEEREQDLLDLGAAPVADAALIGGLPGLAAGVDAGDDLPGGALRAAAVDKLEGGALAAPDGDREAVALAEGVAGDGERLAVHVADVGDAFAGPAVDVGEDAALGIEVAGAAEEPGFAAFEPPFVEAPHARREGGTVHGLISCQSVRSTEGFGSTGSGNSERGRTRDASGPSGLGRGAS